MWKLTLDFGKSPPMEYVCVCVEGGGKGEMVVLSLKRKTIF